MSEQDKKDQQEDFRSPETCRKDFSQNLIAAINDLGYQETQETETMRRQMQDFVGTRSYEEVVEQGAGQEFANMLTAYQLPVERTEAVQGELVGLVSLLMVALLYHELGWNEETNDILNDAMTTANNVDIAGSAEIDIEMLYELQDEALDL
jgi:hypothetical protein